MIAYPEFKNKSSCLSHLRPYLIKSENYLPPLRTYAKMASGLLLAGQGNQVKLVGTTEVNSELLTGLRELFPIRSSGEYSDGKLPAGEKFSREGYVLRKEQLIEEAYPLPVPLNKVSQLKMARGSSFVPTADEYWPLQGHSKLFAIDCEMCGTSKDPRALTMIGMVDENCCKIYKTLVKPPDPILEYRTELTGITKNKMRGVKVTLKDVQAKIKEIVAENPDCILVGHSLCHDLKSIGMTHPYVIDTGVIFQKKKNNKMIKPSLKELMQNILHQDIQEYNHSPIEDAIAAMRLVKRVLKKGDKKCKRAKRN